jgi:integrase
MGKLHIYRRADRGPVWQAQVYVGGRRYRFSCKTDDKPTAREFARQRTQELRERHNRGLVGLPEPVRVSEALDRYERQALGRLRPASRQRAMDVVNAARHFFDGLGDPLLAHVTPREVHAFLDAKRQSGLSARTVNLHRAGLHRILALCVRPWLLIPTNPVSAVEPLPSESREPRVLSESEYLALRTECQGQPMLVLFVTLAWETGARSGELLQLEWGDVDFSAATVTFRNDPVTGRSTKGKRSRTVPLSTVALAALREHAAAFRFAAPLSPYVFTHRRRSRDAEPGQRIVRMYRGFVAAAQRAGLVGLHPHCLRHSFVTRKLAQGVPVALVSRYVGHSQISVTQRYAHLLGEHLRAVVANEESRREGRA